MILQESRNYKNQNLGNHYMSEKLDGIFARWNGINFLSKTGKILNAPPRFKAHMPPPNIQFDGELYIGRNMLDETAGIIRRKNGGWDNVKFHVFDTISNASFYHRYELIKQCQLPDHCCVVEQLECRDIEAAKSWHDEYELDINIKYLSLYSPKEYNFKTNHINSKITNAEFNKLKRKFLKDQCFIGYANESSKSRDGFASFYEGIDAIKENDEILLQYISKYIVKVNRYEIIGELERQNIHELLYNLDFYTENEPKEAA